MKARVLSALVFGALLAGVCSENDLPKTDGDCLKELKLDKATIRTISKQRIVPEDNADYNKFLACSWKEDGGLNDKGEVNWNFLSDQLTTVYKEYLSTYPEDKDVVEAAISLVNIAIEECKEDGIHGADDGQTVAKAKNCISKRIEKIPEIVKK